MVETVSVKTVEQLISSKERVFLLQLDLTLVVFPKSPISIKKRFVCTATSTEYGNASEQTSGFNSFLKN